MDEDVSSNQLTVEWSSNVDGVFDVSTPANNGNTFTLYDGLSLGEHIITMLVTDDAGYDLQRSDRAVDWLCADCQHCSSFTRW